MHDGRVVFQILTAEGFDHVDLSLVRPDIRFEGRFVVYCEGVGEWPQDSFGLVGIHERTGRRVVLGVLGTDGIEEYDFMVFSLRLPVGTWRLQVHSAQEGGVVCRRRVVIE